MKASRGGFVVKCALRGGVHQYILVCQAICVQVLHGLNVLVKVLKIEI